MKRYVAFVIAAAMLLCCFPIQAGAVNVILNSSFLKFPDQEPVIENGVTLVPIRPIAEALGLDVAWNESARLVTLSKDDFYIKLTIDSKTAETSSGTKELAEAPKIINSRTMVPLRFIAETMGLTVLWNDEYQRVIINGQIDTKVETTVAVKSETGETGGVVSEEKAESSDETEEEATEEDEEEELYVVSIAAQSSVISFSIPLSFTAEDTEDETSFAYRAIDATDIQHLYDWTSVTSYESYADSSSTSGILFVVQELEASEETYDISSMNDDYPEAPEAEVTWQEVGDAMITAMVSAMCEERGAEMPDDFADMTDEEAAEALGFESVDEFTEYYSDYVTSFDYTTVEEYLLWVEYQEELSEYRSEYKELSAVKEYAMRNFSTLSSQASDSEWAQLFTEQLNSDSEVRYDGIEILTIGDKKIVHGTIYAEDPDDEQGTFDYYLYYDNDTRVTIYGGTLYAAEASGEAVDALAEMTIE
ncbi:MAG: copper amine oxidase N-terminal domain-containing protein [Clostridia bacterium]|nr:copper amine oxidase N-terminal domain-containing protein [Clostridia bacterium]